MEQYIIILSEKSQAEKPNITCPHLFMESRPKVMITIIIIITMGAECEIRKF
jgi:7,8-dihydro-6-hydroxymethylpterin-pyrophosphokinase